jgi:hypothetical protein
MGEWRTRPREDATNFALVTILQPNFWLFLKDKWWGATSELMTSISNDVQQGLTSRRVGSILPQYSSDDEETEVKLSV